MKRVGAAAFVATLMAWAGIAAAVVSPSTPPTAPSPPAEAAAPVDGGGGIVDGEHHAFLIKAPAGWLFDNESGAGDGLPAIAYRVGETYADSKALLYARGQDYAPVDMPTIDAFIETDLAGMRGWSPGVETFELPPIRLADGSDARVVGYRGDKWGNVEAVAYIALRQSIIVLALSTRSQARFDADLPDFREFVKSYTPLDKE
jgi:hypothetical protein